MKAIPSLYTRLAVILLCIVVTAFTLSRYAMLIQHLLSIKYNGTFELCMVLGMLVFQFPFLYKRPWPEKLDYYYNMLLVSLIGSLLLWPLIIINYFYACDNTVNLIYFFTIVLLMFIEHKRRVAILALPAVMSYTWVVYRCIILIFIV